MEPRALWPVPKELRIITTDYSGAHEAIDLGISIGTELRAPISGIAFRDYTEGGGNCLWIIDALAIRFVHLSEFLVAEGQTVAMGDVVALSGNTGTIIEGPHLHLEVWKNHTPYEIGVPCSNAQVIQLLWRNGADYNRIDPMTVLNDVVISVIPVEVVISVIPVEIPKDKIWNGTPKAEPKVMGEPSRPSDEQFNTFLPHLSLIHI